MIASTLVLRLKAAESFLETKIRITRCEKSRFYPVLAKIRINRGLLYKSFKILSDVMLHVEFVWICNARWFQVWLLEIVSAVSQNAPWAYAWLDVFSVSDQGYRRIEYYFRVGLLLWIASELKPVLKVKLKFVLEFKSQVNTTIAEK